MPFGVNARDNSKFYVGAFELANKPITEISTNIKWAGLPQEQGGFGEYYKAYGRQVSVPKPKLSLDYLCDGEWLPVGDKFYPLSEMNPSTLKLDDRFLFKGSVQVKIRNNL